MHRLARATLAVSALSLGLMLAGCESMDQFDPTDLFSSDIFVTKKKLQGERQPVFPEGTPGVPQGVPAELIKGNQAAAEPATTQAIPETPEKKQAAAEPEPKPKPKPKPRVVAKPPQEPPASKPTAVTVRRSDSPWPEPDAQQQQQQQQPQQQPQAQAQPQQGAWPGAQRGGTIWPDPPR
jgi:outer membrane biosynthesis protein TonB